MLSHFLTYKSSVIHYIKNENSEKPILLCFHGYGETATSFNFLDRIIGNDFTIIAPDLPLHGETIWKEGLNFSSADLLEIIRQILNAHSLTGDDFYFLGYSMGARIAMASLEHFPMKVNRLLLFAPDGLRMNFWYWLCTQTFLGNRFFRYVLHHPGAMLKLLYALNKFRLINASIYKFIDHYISNKKVREDLYNRWTMMRKFKPRIKKVKKIIIEEKIQTKMLYGKFDRIIRFERAEKFRNGIEKYCTVEIVESGHQLLHEKNVETIVRLIKN